ncbi:hypothetical protein [Candidatus Coxiella mudrowiae]|uniref:hypothetical protein n=1 Tax=Candidatus Coxiella mudrowiae TaxID=2054173 RepID=UPI0006627F79|nr:hypothetical protein [Candidatus Coxiella mudrowiae]
MKKKFLIEIKIILLFTSLDKVITNMAFGSRKLLTIVDRFSKIVIADELALERFWKRYDLKIQTK